MSFIKGSLHNTGCPLILVHFLRDILTTVCKERLIVIRSYIQDVW